MAGNMRWTRDGGQRGSDDARIKILPEHDGDLRRRGEGGNIVETRRGDGAGGIDDRGDTERGG